MGITKHGLLIFALLCIGLFFRWLEPGKYAFGFDQIQILTNAISIRGGDPTLLGPRTGPAEMFTGPLIYYLAAVVYVFIPSPWALVGTSLVIAAVTGVALFFLARRYFSEKIGYIILFFWAFSPFLIRFDRVVWNPNLTILASTLVFFPLLYHLLGKKLQFNDLVLIFFGVFLGFQAHFSGLFLLPMFFAVQLIWRRIDIRSLIVGGLGLVATLAPTVLFDMRNNWLNLRGLERFLSNTDEVHSSIQLFRLQDALGISVSNLGHILTAHLAVQFSLFMGGFFSAAVFVLIARELTTRFRSNKNPQSFTRECTILLAALLWSIILAILLSFYSSTPPEYYFFLHLPALLLMLAILTTRLQLQLSSTGVASLVLILVVHNASTFSLFSETSHYAIGNQMKLTADLAQRNAEFPIKSIVYDMQPVDALGIEYFITSSLRLHPEGDIVHIIGDAPQTKQYNRLGVWFDPRTDETKSYITQRDVVIASKSGLSLLRDYYRGADFGSNRVFQVFADDVSTGETLVLIDANTNPFDPASDTYKNFIADTTPVPGLTGWQWSKYNGVEGFARHEESFSLLYVPSNNSQIAPNRVFEIDVTSIIPRLLY